MGESGDDRSVQARDIIGSNVITGDHNTASTRMHQVPLPPADQVDAKAQVVALHELFTRLNAPECGKLDRAMQDAAEEVAKPDPDKEEIGGALSRAVKYAKAADDFGEHAEKLMPRLAALGSWLGTHGKSLLAMVGIGP